MLGSPTATAGTSSGFPTGPLLPPDVLLIICEFLVPNNKDILSLALTCRTLSSLALPLLWRHATFIIAGGKFWTYPSLPSTPRQRKPKYTKHPSGKQFLSTVGQQYLPFIHNLELRLCLTAQHLPRSRSLLLPAVERDIEVFFAVLNQAWNLRHLGVYLAFETPIAEVIFKENRNKWADELMQVVSRYAQQEGQQVLPPSASSSSSSSDASTPQEARQFDNKFSALQSLTLSRGDFKFVAAECLAVSYVLQQAPNLKRFSVRNVYQKTWKPGRQAIFNDDGSLHAVDLSQESYEDFTTFFDNKLDDISTVRHVKLTAPAQRFIPQLEQMRLLESVRFIGGGASDGFGDMVNVLLNILSSRASSTTTTTTTAEPGTEMQTARFKGFQLKPQHTEQGEPLKLKSHVPLLVRFLTYQSVDLELQVLKLGFYSSEVLLAIKIGRLCPNLVVLRLGFTPQKERTPVGGGDRGVRQFGTPPVWRLVCEATAHMTHLETLSMKMLVVDSPEDVNFLSSIPQRIASLRNLVLKGRTRFSLSEAYNEGLVGTIRSTYPQMKSVKVDLKEIQPEPSLRPRWAGL
ncbi:hypothetical protein HK102_013007 [Quaeritorhiza haematococci]|nr:hypothetical protein HK102_013007 [Quaeritorhiza haematococci]